MHVIGARPQFIKYSPIQRAMESALSAGAMVNVLVHTGQHYDYLMSEIFFAELGIRGPDYHLEVGSGHHGWQTGLVLQRTEEVILKELPHVVVVYGDTNSTLGAALAAAKRCIPVAHVEAGLRSFRKAMPEEINHVVADHLSTILFCPSEASLKNLQREGFPAPREDYRNAGMDHPAVFITGDVMYDMLLHAISLAGEKSSILRILGIEGKPYDLMTIHRAENTDVQEQMEAIIGFVNEATSGHQVIFPMHPRMAKTYNTSNKRFGNHVRVIEPLGYFDLIWLLKNSRMVLTDSGGMQKEAYWLRVPCITLREETEWVETVGAGWNVLFKNYKDFRFSLEVHPDLYGDGQASEKIIQIIQEVIC